MPPVKVRIKKEELGKGHEGSGSKNVIGKMGAKGILSPVPPLLLGKERGEKLKMLLPRVAARTEEPRGNPGLFS